MGDPWLGTPHIAGGFHTEAECRETIPVQAQTPRSKQLDSRRAWLVSKSLGDWSAAGAPGARLAVLRRLTLI